MSPPRASLALMQRDEFVIRAAELASLATDDRCGRKIPKL
jgi:hypothetical protein